MALITNDIQARLAKLLSEEGLVRAEVISQSVENAKAANQSLIAYFLENKIVDNEILVHAISYVSGVPYVNLATSSIDQSILDLVPLDIAERNMAVPIAEVQNRLAVAMLDATNVQAVDYLSKIGRAHV